MNWKKFLIAILNLERMPDKLEPYILEKTVFFMNLLMPNITPEEILCKEINLLHDEKSQENYLAFYNEIINELKIERRKNLTLNDLLNPQNSLIEMQFNRDIQYFFKIEKNILRADVLYSNKEQDICTYFYDLNELKEITNLKENYKNIFEFITSQEFQTQISPQVSIISLIKADVYQKPKTQVIYIEENGKTTSIPKNTQKSIEQVLKNHNEVVTNTISDSIYLKRKKQF